MLPVLLDDGSVIDLSLASRLAGGGPRSLFLRDPAILYTIGARL